MGCKEKQGRYLHLVNHALLHVLHNACAGAAAHHRPAEEAFAFALLCADNAATARAVVDQRMPHRYE